MEWTDEHDVLMLREMIVSDVFSFKKGSVGRGDAWGSIAEKLNQIDSPQFRIKETREVLESAGYCFDENFGQRSERRRRLVVSSLKI